MSNLADYPKMKQAKLEQAQRDTSLPSAHREMIDLCLTRLRLHGTLEQVNKQIETLIEENKAEPSAEHEEKSG